MHRQGVEQVASCAGQCGHDYPEDELHIDEQGSGYCDGCWHDGYGEFVSEYAEYRVDDTRFRDIGDRINGLY